MQSIGIGIFLVFLVVYGVSSFRINDDEENNSMSLPFQDQIVEVFQAFGKGDIDRMEKIFKFLENIDPNELNKLDDSNLTTDYRNERINYVVSLHYIL